MTSILSPFFVTLIRPFDSQLRIELLLMPHEGHVILSPCRYVTSQFDHEATGTQSAPIGLSPHPHVPHSCLQITCPDSVF